MANDLLNALHRLQRTGDEYSGTNLKLLAASVAVAEQLFLVVRIVPAKHPRRDRAWWLHLPRDYALYCSGSGEPIALLIPRKVHRGKRRGDRIIVDDAEVLYCSLPKWKEQVNALLAGPIPFPKDSPEDRLLNRINMGMKPPTISGAHLFAKDVATGLLDEVADWLQREYIATTDAFASLEKAKDDVEGKQS